jgi:hypothetical protein
MIWTPSPPPKSSVSIRAFAAPYLRLDENDLTDKTCGVECQSFADV